MDGCASLIRPKLQSISPSSRQPTRPGNNVEVTLGDFEGPTLHDACSDQVRVPCHGFERELTGSTAHEMLDDDTQSTPKPPGYRAGR